MRACWLRWFDAENLFRLALSICMVCAATIIVGEQAQAQFRTLRTFEQTDLPVGKPLIIGSKLYGTFTQQDAGTGVDSLFRINLDGTGYEVLHTFEPAQWTELGNRPSGQLGFDGSHIFGTTFWGGSNDRGTLYSYELATGTVQALHQFSSSGGSGPGIGVAVEGNTVYGSAGYSIFRMQTDGTNFQILRDFTGENEGIAPSNLLVNNGTIYATLRNSTTDKGSVFSMKIDGTDYAQLHEFFQTTPATGRNPEYSPLYLEGTTLYGTTNGFGIVDFGSAFKIDVDGSDYQNLHQFNAADGATPRSLVRVGDKLVGLTLFDFVLGGGNLFAMNLDGSGFEILHVFPPAVRDRPSVSIGLTVDGNTVYGFRASEVGYYPATLFSYTVPEPSSIALLSVGLLCLWRTKARRRR
jgi:uncharacterized repeat protein (TIGR03803 family)